MLSIKEKEGYRFFYKGCFPRIIRTCGAFGICMYIQEIACQYKMKNL